MSRKLKKKKERTDVTDKINEDTFRHIFAVSSKIGTGKKKESPFINSTTFMKLFQAEAMLLPVTVGQPVSRPECLL